jgi:hypothetical protein
VNPVQTYRVKMVLLVLLIVYAVPLAALGAYKLLKPTSSGQIEYGLAWNTAGVQREQNAWVWTSNLGYTVRLERGFVNTYGLQLLSCPHSHSWWETLLSNLEPLSGTALAGHSPGQDPAAINSNRIESLLPPVHSSFPAVTVHEPNYCQGYLVAARATLSSQSTSSKNVLASMNGKSIFLRGTFEKNGLKKPFVISSENAFGDAHALENPSGTVHATISEKPIRVEFVRSLRGLFDDLEFATDSAFDQGMTVLRNLNKHVRVRVVSGMVHPK